MTIEEQFNDYGCACRCLLALAHSQGVQITKEAFMAQYLKKYPAWETHNKCGVTNSGMILDIARELKLAKSFQIFRNPNTVREWMRDGRTNAVLLCTEMKENRDAITGVVTYSEYFHCTLVALSASLKDGFQWYQVDAALQCIQLDEMPEIRDIQIDALGGYFLVLLSEET